MMENKVVGHYELTPMPGCTSAVAISHGLFIQPEYRGKGYGSKAHAERLEKAKSLGFQVLIATTKSDNTPEVKILQKYGWKRCREFWNPKTTNTVTFWLKHLTDPYAEWGGT